MRPLRLELAGFTSFREPAVVDFSDADFFVLAGPTGSGKSTIIDAICFALYGSVPRYEHRGLVAPVITQGQLEARVRLDFAVDDDVYTAVRVVRRQGKGASTKEARLERAGEVIAGTADELTEEVTKLIGLSFDHFTRCVVLPQGEFARFLHDNPKDRQHMLVGLLNLGIYQQMRQAASARAAEIKARVEVGEARLSEDFAFANEQTLADAEGRVAALRKLRSRVDRAMPRLQVLESELAAAAADAETASSWIDLLEALSIPAEVERMADSIAHAHKRIEEATTGAAATAKRLAAAEEAIATLPDRVPLAHALKSHQSKRASAAKLDDARAALRDALSAEKVAREELVKASKVAADAASLARAAERAHAALHLAGSLEAGRPCPVCFQTVDEVPVHKPSADLERAADAVKNADRALEQARATHAAASSAGERAAVRLQAVEETIAGLDDELRDFPDESEVTRALKQVDEAESDLRSARAAEKDARAELDVATKELRRLKEAEEGGRRQFEATRDRLVPLAPPPAARQDLAADWAGLLAWSQTQVVEQRAALERAKKAARKTTDRKKALLEELRSACVECRLDVSDDDILEATIAAATEAANEVARVRKGITDAESLRKRLASDKVEHDLAHQLSLHLSANPGRFENWIVNEALQRLVAGATMILKELSGDQYALAVDETGTFLVVDNHNAGEARSARTLSGGETFLASLSLALALSDQLVELAARGAARLDAIFLDEGFGTLDPETLDTVAATVENLAAQGRMVGIVTHVRELAERVPLRFRVRKEAGTSSVERIGA